MIAYVSYTYFVYGFLSFPNLKLVARALFLLFLKDLFSEEEDYFLSEVMNKISV